MYEHNINLIRLCLPLLADPRLDTRRQMAIIVRSLYGERAIEYVRQLIQDDDEHVRFQARAALQSLHSRSASEVDPLPPQGIEVRCLGPLRVRINGKPFTFSQGMPGDNGRAGWQKAQAIFAYLVHCGPRGASRRALGEAVWGSSGASKSSLSRTISSLRQWLLAADEAGIVERALVITPSHCILDGERYSSDVVVFEQVYQQAVDSELETDLATAAPLYTQALDLYSGPYMADVLPGSGWIQDRRAQLAGAFVNAVERLAELAYTQGEYQRCIDLCQTALDAIPESDDVVCWLMRSYMQLGQHAAFEHAYRRYLRVAGIDLASPEDRHDLVVVEYQHLSQTHTLGTRVKQVVILAESQPR